MLLFATVIFSPIISSMSGKVADAVFSKWKGINYIRERVIPSNPQSDLQTAQRLALARTLTMWQSVKSWAKTVWNHYATGYAKSGYNRYMEDVILHTKAGTAGHLTPFNPAYIKISTQAAVAGAAGIITISWTNLSGVSGVDFMQNWVRKTQAGAEEYAWTSSGGPDITAETYDILGLDTGEEYEIAFFACTEGVAIAQESFNKVLLAG